jgi:hypothetical protein
MSPYLYPLENGWPSYTPRHRVPILIASYDMHGLQWDYFFPRSSHRYILILFAHFRSGLESDFFPSRFQTKILFSPCVLRVPLTHSTGCDHQNNIRRRIQIMKFNIIIMFPPCCYFHPKDKIFSSALVPKHPQCVFSWGKNLSSTSNTDKITII